eukprot:CAMPEP_0184532652 /NCGR_PEP_ID=MMETSP0198_2-20121128/14288_1 /TAXON_ID=1112570 /ORGANISM="Thraustochytrium sp., Strain LLF1b" /LENGTH=34 /DNA_ID= /DNA_START= /DNA_END= /DNA_ORIENTATION=
MATEGTPPERPGGRESGAPGRETGSRKPPQKAAA